MPEKIKITLTRSPIGNTERQKNTVRALGLRKMQHSVEHDDTPVVRGMIHKVRHLVVVEAAAQE